MARGLKKWNGRGHDEYVGAHFCIAAYSVKQAAELATKFSGGGSITPYEINTYYAQCWGNSMEGINPTTPCIYVVYTNGPKSKLAPQLLLKLVK